MTEPSMVRIPPSDPDGAEPLARKVTHNYWRVAAFASVMEALTGHYSGLSCHPVFNREASDDPTPAAWVPAAADRCAPVSHLA
jgi:hypothetical protein